MKTINDRHITNIEIGPKIAYQCDCACPRSTPAEFSKENNDVQVNESQYTDQSMTITVK